MEKSREELLAELEALRASQLNTELLLAGILKITTQAIIAVDENQQIILFNKGAETLFGYTAEEIIGQSLTMIMSQRFRAPSRGHFGQFLETSQSDEKLFTHIQISAHHKSGQSIAAEASISRIERDGKKLLSILIDELDHKENIPEQLQEQQRLFKLYNELSTDYVFSVGFDENRKFYYRWFTREAFKLVTGYDAFELADVNDIYHPEDRARADADRALSAQGISTEGEYRIITKSGEIRWLNLKRFAEWNEDHTEVLYLHGVAKDVTARYRAEEERRQSDEQYRMLAENSNDMIWVLNADGKFLYFSPAIESFLGYTAEEAMQFTLRELVAPESLMLANTIREKYLNTSEVIRETTRLELLHKRKDGSYIWSETVVRGLYDSDGKFTHFIGNSRDISERKLNEEQRLELLSEQARVQSMTKFITGTSHDLMTSLSIIKTNVYLLQKMQDEGRRMAKLASIENQTQRLQEIIQDMLTLLRLDSIDPRQMSKEPVKLREFLPEIMPSFQRRADQKQQDLILSLPEESLVFLANTNSLTIALTKIIENAIHYTPNGGQIRVFAARVDRFMQIGVDDTGIGITKEDLEHIFERFYRAEEARPSDQGTGLGLSIVKAVMDLHSGHILTHSVVGKGSSFILCFPID